MSPSSRTRGSSSLRARLSRYAEEHDYALIFFDPPEHFDHAILGLIHGFHQEPCVLYDQAKVLAALVDSGMSEEQAEEWFAFNTIGAWVGEATPRFLFLAPDDPDLLDLAPSPAPRRPRPS